MSNIILTQIPAQFKFEYTSIIMSTVKFINEIIWICFSASTFKFKVDQC